MKNRTRFFYNGILLTCVGLAIRSVSLGLNAFTSRSIGAEGIGLFTLIGTIYAFAVTFATSGISLSVTRIVSSAIGEGREDEVSGIVRSAIAYALIFGSAATLTLLLFAPYFASRIICDVRAELPIRILSLSLIPTALSSVFGGYFIGVKRVSRNATVQVLGQIFKAFISVLLIIKFAKRGAAAGTAILCICITATEILVFLIALFEFLIDKKRYLKNSKKGSHFSQITSMALPLAVSAYIRSALLSLEHMLIPRSLRLHGESHEDSLASYGILHGMALPVLLYPMSPLSSFAGLLVPEFSESEARSDTKRMRRIAGEAFNTTMAYSLAAMVFLAMFSEEIGYAVYDSYEAGSYISVMSIVIPIMYLDHITDSILKGIGEHVFAMWVNISDSVISILLVIILLPRMGILGYAIVIIVMEGYNFALSFIRLRKKIKFKIGFIVYGIVPLLCAFISFIITKALFKSLGAFVTPGLLILKIIFAVCVFFAFYLSISSLQKKQTIKTADSY